MCAHGYTCRALQRQCAACTYGSMHVRSSSGKLTSAMKCAGLCVPWQGSARLASVQVCCWREDALPVLRVKVSVQGLWPTSGCAKQAVPMPPQAMCGVSAFQQRYTPRAGWGKGWVRHPRLQLWCMRFVLGRGLCSCPGVCACGCAYKESAAVLTGSVCSLSGPGYRCRRLLAVLAR